MIAEDPAAKLFAETFFVVREVLDSQESPKRFLVQIRSKNKLQTPGNRHKVSVNDESSKDHPVGVPHSRLDCAIVAPVALPFDFFKGRNMSICKS